MIKNWTVTTQAVKNGTDGMIARERYLLAQNHPNHRTSEKLISLIGSEQTTQHIALMGERFRLNQQLKGKGGRPLSSFGVEFCLTLPKGHRPTTKQWKAIVSDCYLAFANFLQLTPQERTEFKKQFRAVVHQQTQTGKRGAGDHVHLIVGKVLNGRVLIKLQQKVGTKLIKQAFNAAVLKHAGLDHREYQPYELNKGKRLETWKYREHKAAEAIEVEKTISKMQIQADKWLKAFSEKDTKQKKRQRNRLIKTFEELSVMAVTATQKDSIDQLKSALEKHSGCRF
ncbi:hypothetical protein [Vibrio sp. DNB22_19_1]